MLLAGRRHEGEAGFHRRAVCQAFRTRHVHGQRLVQAVSECLLLAHDEQQGGTIRLYRI